MFAVSREDSDRQTAMTGQYDVYIEDQRVPPNPDQKMMPRASGRMAPG